MKNTHDQTSSYNHIKIYWRGIRLIQKLVPSLLPTVAGSALLKALCPFITIYMTARIIDELIGARSFSQLTTLVLLTISLNFAALFLQRILERIMENGEELLNYQSVQRMDQSILCTDYQNVEKPDFHLKKQKIDEAANMSGRGIWALPDLSHRFLTNLCTVITAIFLAFPAFLPSDHMQSFLASPWMSAIFLAIVILSSLYSFFSNSRFSRIFFQKMDTIMVVNRIFKFYGHLMHDHQTGKDVRIYQQQGLIQEAYHQFLGRFYQFDQIIAHMQGSFNGINAAISSVITGIVYLLVGMKALMGLISIGSVVQYAGAISQFTSGFSELITSATGSWQNIDYLKLYFDFIDTENPKYQGTLPVEKRSDNDYEIEFRDVSFKYPGAKAYALRHLSFKLKVGLHFAVVGPNGSGKTTFIKLLCRLYEAQEGEILLNGIAIQKYNYQEYLSLFSVVFQDFQLFAFSAGQNVAAKVNYDQSRVMACLDQAGIGSRVRQMPNGLKTPLYKIDAEGVDISGGEAQKIAIARALYKGAPFVVLDEPTAALDPVAEFDIYSKFQSLVGSRTAIYISHRLASCRFCDHILVFNAGEIVQSGTHDELIQDREGLYYSLWNAQAKYYQRKPS
ncbi:MAG: ABC transporter ATP-binding protein [Sporolactobacillus sp.]